MNVKIEESWRKRLQEVKLINPRITTDGYKIGERGFVNYILLADDMLPAESK